MPRFFFVLYSKWLLGAKLLRERSRLSALRLIVRFLISKLGDVYVYQKSSGFDGDCRWWDASATAIPCRHIDFLADHLPWLGGHSLEVRLEADHGRA